MKTFRAFYNGQTRDITGANSSYHAQQAAALLWKVKPRNQYKISVFLISENGEPVTHSTAELN